MYERDREREYVLCYYVKERERDPNRIISLLQAPHKSGHTDYRVTGREREIERVCVREREIERVCVLERERGRVYVCVLM